MFDHLLIEIHVMYICQLFNVSILVMHTKGQLISKCPFGVIVSTKIPTKFIIFWFNLFLETMAEILKKAITAKTMITFAIRVAFYVWKDNGSTNDIRHENAYNTHRTAE